MKSKKSFITAVLFCLSCIGLGFANPVNSPSQDSSVLIQVHGVTNDPSQQNWVVQVDADKGTGPFGPDVGPVQTFTNSNVGDFSYSTSKNAQYIAIAMNTRSPDTIDVSVNSDCLNQFLNLKSPEYLFLSKQNSRQEWLHFLTGDTGQSFTVEIHNHFSNDDSCDAITVNCLSN